MVRVVVESLGLMVVNAVVNAVVAAAMLAVVWQQEQQHRRYW